MSAKRKIRLTLATCLAVALVLPAHAQTTKPAKPGVKNAAPAAAAPAQPDSDVAYGAYQRGHYLTAFAEAKRRADATGDPKSMTLLGELYANGQGVPLDENKAAEWYKLAAGRGDRQAMFQLALFRFTGRGGPTNRDEAVKLFTAAAKLGHPAAAYNLGLLYLDGDLFPQDFARAAELFRTAAEAGNPEAQYALGTFYKEGRGVKQDPREAARWLGAASSAGIVDAEVEYAIALFNGNGVTKNEAAATDLFLKSARRGSPIAQNRMANILARGMGRAADPVEAAKWHLIAKAGGNSDPWMDDFVAKLTPDQRAEAQKAAKPWLEILAFNP